MELVTTSETEKSFKLTAITEEELLSWVHVITKATVTSLIVQ